MWVCGFLKKLLKIQVDFTKGSRKIYLKVPPVSFEVPSKYILNLFEFLMMKNIQKIYVYWSKGIGKINS